MNINKISAYKAIHILYWPSVFLPLQATTIILSKIYRSCFFCAEPEGKALNLSVKLGSSLHLCS